MRRVTMTLVLSASMLLIGSASARSDTPTARDIMRSAKAAVIIPIEWDGTWTVVDTVYNCPSTFQSTSTSTDTLCGGADYGAGAPGSTIQFVCTGTADATTFDQTCTGSFDVFTDCTANYTVVSHGTRTGDTYHSVSTINVTYSGTGIGCSLLSPSCLQVDSWGTRTGPAPTDFCSTEARRSTWGQVKIRYH